MSDIKHILDFLNKNPGYLKVGASRLGERLGCSEEDARVALKKQKSNSNENDNVISEFEKFLSLSSIDSKDIVSVKFWQTQSGEPRFSVVTKNDVDDHSSYKTEIEKFAKIYSTNQTTPRHSDKVNDPVAYEISLPDIHYGKIVESKDNIEDVFLNVIYDLVEKAKGLNIDRILLPIGNDGLNSEGMRQSTTKGTPQHDNAGWKQTFRGYWNLLVVAIDYLKTIAPVDVIVVSGNHDYERMYYVGDVIAGWYRDDKNVTVNNNNEPRKYYNYGENMLMFTHGDNEKPQDMPLIMATEQPEMFANTTHREAHCGHFHKEQVNEYRGIKVRFLPSICPNDEWHKKMGYDSKRSAQGFIWSKERGLEGYIQCNV